MPNLSRAILHQLPPLRPCVCGQTLERQHITMDLAVYLRDQRRHHPHQLALVHAAPAGLYLCPACGHRGWFYPGSPAVDVYEQIVPIVRGTPPTP